MELKNGRKRRKTTRARGWLTASGSGCACFFVFLTGLLSIRSRSNPVETRQQQALAVKVKRISALLKHSKIKIVPLVHQTLEWLHIIGRTSHYLPGKPRAGLSLRRLRGGERKEEDQPLRVDASSGGVAPRTWMRSSPICPEGHRGRK